MKIEDLSVGDVIYFPVKWEAKIHHGEIKSLHPDDDMEPCVSLFDSVGSWRTIACSQVFLTLQEAKIYRKKIKENKE